MSVEELNELTEEIYNSSKIAETKSFLEDFLTDNPENSFEIKTSINRYDENDKKLNKKGTFVIQRKYEDNRNLKEKVFVFREFDRKHNTYKEYVVSKDNKIIHENEESLTDHTNHGNAKKSSMSHTPVSHSSWKKFLSFLKKYFLKKLKFS